MKKPDITPVEVDMVPLIDIISLLLMFLIIVGDTTANTTSIKMKLPAADQAKADDWPGTDTKNRIVIQLARRDDEKYYAVLNNVKHNPEEEAGKTLKDHLAAIVDEAAKKNLISRRNDETWNMPVKLRIPEECPILEVEKVLATVANLQLVDIQYAAAKK